MPSYVVVAQDQLCASEEKSRLYSAEMQRVKAAFESLNGAEVQRGERDATIASLHAELAEQRVGLACRNFAVWDVFKVRANGGLPTVSITKVNTIFIP